LHVATAQHNLRIAAKNNSQHKLCTQSCAYQGQLPTANNNEMVVVEKNENEENSGSGIAKGKSKSLAAFA